MLDQNICSLGNTSPGSGGGGAKPSAEGAANPLILATALTLVAGVPRLALPRFWVSIRSYKKKNSQKFWG